MDARGAAGFNGSITVTLEGKDGTVCGQAQITGLKPAWSRLSASINAGATDPEARLTMSTNQSRKFWVNVVSLPPGKDILGADNLHSEIKNL